MSALAQRGSRERIPRCWAPKLGAKPTIQKVISALGSKIFTFPAHTYPTTVSSFFVHNGVVSNHNNQSPKRPRLHHQRRSHRQGERRRCLGRRFWSRSKTCTRGARMSILRQSRRLSQLPSQTPAKAQHTDLQRPLPSRPLAVNSTSILSPKAPAISPTAKSLSSGLKASPSRWSGCAMCRCHEGNPVGDQS